jgi:hypothetical protein
MTVFRSNPVGTDRNKNQINDIEGIICATLTVSWKSLFIYPVDPPTISTKPMIIKETGNACAGFNEDVPISNIY